MAGRSFFGAAHTPFSRGLYDFRSQSKAYFSVTPQALHVNTCMSTRLSSYAGSTSVSGIWPPHAMQTILVVIALGDRCVSMALPLPPTCFGANAKDANPKATVAKCGRLVGSDSIAEYFPPISTRSRVGRRKRCRASSCAASSGRQVEPVEPRRGAAEQIRLFGRTCRSGQNLARVPVRRVAIGALVHRT